MANILTLIRKRRAAGANIITFVYQCVVSGSYADGGSVGVPGETLNFDAASNPNKISRPKLPRGPAAKLPANTDIRVERIPGGFGAQVEQNATAPTPANYAMRIFGAGSGGTVPAELTGGTYASVAPALTATGEVGFEIEVDVPAKYA